MNLKELFEKAENGSLTYDAFNAAVKDAGIKLADLASGDYVSKKKFDDELAAKNDEISTLNSTINQRDVDLKELQTKLSEAGNDVEKLGQLSNDLTSLQSKYDADVKQYQEKLSKQAYEFAVKEFAGTKNFSSNAAKRDFINSMIAKELKMDNGKILGADDFVTAYSADNEDAFIVSNPTPDEGPKSLPRFVEGTPGVNVHEEEGFKFGFTGVRSHD